MIGQARIKKLGRLALESRKNVIIVGPSGHGKSMLAREICFGSVIILLNPLPPMEILEYFEWNMPSKFIVCDEIHSCTKQDLWPLFMDNFMGSVLFTTTDPHKVIEAITTRSLLLELDPYSLEEIQSITGLKGQDGEVISKLSRRVPRVARNLGQLYRNFPENIDAFLEILGVREYEGRLLFSTEIAYLELLQDGVKSRKSLMAALNMANFEGVELGLVRLGLVEITDRGRKHVKI